MERTHRDIPVDRTTTESVADALASQSAGSAAFAATPVTEHSPRIGVRAYIGGESQAGTAAPSLSDDGRVILRDDALQYAGIPIPGTETGILPITIRGFLWRGRGAGASMPKRSGQARAGQRRSRQKGVGTSGGSAFRSEYRVPIYPRTAVAVRKRKRTPRSGETPLHRRGATWCPR